MKNKAKMGKHGKHAAEASSDAVKAQAKASARTGVDGNAMKAAAQPFVAHDGAAFEGGGHRSDASVAGAPVLPVGSTMVSGDAASRFRPPSFSPRMDEPAQAHSRSAVASAFRPSSDGQAQDTIEQVRSVDGSSHRFHLKNLFRGKRKIPFIILGILLLTYLAGVLYFMGHFYPRTSMADMDVSNKTAAEVESMLAQKSSNYSLQVTGEGIDFSITAKQAGLSVDGAAAVSAALETTSPWLWPYEVFVDHDMTSALVASANDSGLSDIVSTQVSQHNASATPSTNATISYSSATGTFRVVPETYGDTLDSSKVLAAVDDAVAEMRSTVTVDSSMCETPAVTQGDSRLSAAAAKANKLVGGTLTLDLGSTPVVSLAPSQIASWVTLDADLNPTVASDAFRSWCQQLATACTTVGTKRTYTRPDGVTCSVSGGSYGWTVDEAALESALQSAIATGQSTTVSIPTTTQGAMFTAAGAQDWGASYVDVDLTKQHARYYDASGNLAWETDVVTGIPDGEHNTPEGVYYIITKESPSTLIGYDTKTGSKLYETVVSYWMPFVGSAIGLHDASWQSAFGGTRYEDGYGSHGCVNLSVSKAQELYGLVSVGTPVIVHY